MNDQMRESLSALMDDEANELELGRVLKHAEQDDTLRATWARYNQVSQAVRGQHIALRDADISERVRSRLGAGDDDSAKRTWWRPVASLAVAASVAATVLVGGQQLATLSADGDGVPSNAVAASASPVGLVNSLGATSVQASFGTQSVPVLQPATRQAYHELARQRMDRYMQEHAQHAALNSPQGLIPFARVPEIRK